MGAEEVRVGGTSGAQVGSAQPKLVQPNSALLSLAQPSLTPCTWYWPGLVQINSAVVNYDLPSPIPPHPHGLRLSAQPCSVQPRLAQPSLAYMLMGLLPSVLQRWFQECSVIAQGPVDVEVPAGRVIMCFTP